jgi:uncharacterized protein YjbI with pentapeptide repeats
MSAEAPVIQPQQSPPRPPLTPDAPQHIIDDHAAQQMIAEHKVWLTNEGVRGVRAVFRDAVCRSVQFGGDLSRADFQGSRLERCTFEPGTDLTEADFSEADLTSVDLSETKNLSEHRLGASKLSYAKLPKDFTFAGLEAARELAGKAERILFALLASCATVVILTRVIPLVHLFQPEEAIKLPVLGLPVPARTFFNLAPWLLLVTYVYLLATLLKFWGALRDLPAIMPNHRLLFREIPSSPNFAVVPFGWCWRSFPHGGNTEQEEARNLAALTRGDRVLVSLTVWWMTPLTIAWVWLSYLPLHSTVDSRIQVLAVVLAFTFSVASYGQMLAHLTRGFRDRTGVHLKLLRSAGTPRKVSTMSLLLYTDSALRGVPENAPRKVHPATVATVSAATLLLAAGISHWAFTNRECEDDRQRYGAVRSACYRFGANLERAQLGSVWLNEQNLDRAFLHSAVLEKAQLEDARLRWAQLSDVKAKKANLKDARLQGAILWEAELDEAELKEARLQRADLRGASLVGAQLQGARLNGADLRGANLTRANLCGADYTDARVNPDSLVAQAHGEELRRGRVHDGPLAATRHEIPDYLEGKDRTEFGRWALAEHQTEWLAAHTIRWAHAGWLPRRQMLVLVDRIDVTMGASTQRKQIALLDFIRSYAVTDGRRLPYTPELLTQLGGFIADVQQKARNHCVLPARIVLPRAGPSLSPSTGWGSKVGLPRSPDVPPAASPAAPRPVR